AELATALERGPVEVRAKARAHPEAAADHRIDLDALGDHRLRLGPVRIRLDRRIPGALVGGEDLVLGRRFGGGATLLGPGDRGQTECRRGKAEDYRPFRHAHHLSPVYRGIVGDADEKYVRLSRPCPVEYRPFSPKRFWRIPLDAGLTECSRRHEN